MNRPRKPRRIIIFLVVASLYVGSSACSGLPRPMAFHDPLTVSEHVVLGETYRKQGDKEGAAREFEAAIKQDSHYLPALIAMGDLAFEKKNWDDAESYYRNVLELSPENPVAANNLAMVYLSKGERLDETEQLAKHALNQDTNFRPYILETLASLYIRQGRLEEAQHALDEIEVTLRPNQIALQERLRELRREIAERHRHRPAPP